MAEVQDEEQWLYGDEAKNSASEKQNEQSSTTTNLEAIPQSKGLDSEDPPAPVSTETNGETEKGTEEERQEEPEQNGEKTNDNADDDNDTSSDDEPTVTIGKIVKQPDVMRPPPPTHRAAPTSGLKDDDFHTAGKINGVEVADFNLQELEDKPWRKPGADLSDYFNYGFTEDTWIKYCERQKAMRNRESGIGLSGLGINLSRGMLGTGNITVPVVKDFPPPRKYNNPPPPKPYSEKDSYSTPSSNNTTPAVNTIQVMTADRRTYSNKVLSGGMQGGVFDDMDFGGPPPPYGGGDFFNTPPPPNFYAPPPGPPWGGMPPPVPPPGWGPGPETMGPPPPIAPPHRVDYFEDDAPGPPGLANRPIKEERDVEKIRDVVESRDKDHKESRHHSRRRSRSPSKARRRSRSRSKSKSRHRRRSRSRSRSRSPSHRHKKKKSKRERDGD